MTGYILPELVLESIIRDGIQNVRNDLTIIDSVFAQLTRSYNSRKYGEDELVKIKALIQKEIAVVFSYHEVESRQPCFSIMIGSDTEDKARAHLDDYYSIECEPIDPEDLVLVEDVIITSYDPIFGRVVVDDSVDLSSIYKGMVLVDSLNEEFTILGGIDNALGSKSFFIEKNADIEITGNALIRSGLDHKVNEVKGVTGDETLVIGVHSKDALTTKYLYILLKYFIISRKKDMIKRSFYLASYSGSDFNKDQAYLGDQIYTRFLTITGKIDDTWRSDQVVLIDNVDLEATPIE